MEFSPQDPTSFSRPDHHIVKHIDFDLSVDFKRKVLSGSAKLSVDTQKKNEQFILDVSSLVVLKVSLLSGESLPYTVGDAVPDVGSKMTITLPDTVDDCFVVCIEYETSPEASALQWLDPEQTAGKQLPYLFSQCQAIHARSIAPCQDTPAVKFTYNAAVSAQPEFTVLMSAVRQKQKEAEGVRRHTFKQEVPIPSYLLAIAVGALESRVIGPRSSVWAEKEVIEQSAYEFAETDKMLNTAIELLGPYVWGVYDVLVLPPSFPYGGMENPCLTFVTPTLLAGDRSLADVIVHEITHSWTGNLVTNRNFEHFWLNEGFTVFAEQKISSRLYGEKPNDTKYRDFLALEGLSALKDTINQMGDKNPLTNLVVDLKGLNPDDAFSTVPYMKGSTFLRYLEILVGGPDAFEPFLRTYLDHFKRQSIDTDDFIKYFNNYFSSNENIKNIEWEQWLHTPGMPLHIPNYDTSMEEACRTLTDKWANCGRSYSQFTPDDIKSLTSLQVIQFLSLMLERVQDIEEDMVKALQDIYKLNESKNCEIKFRWLRICIKARWMDKVGDALKFVNEQGRMKYVRPIYRDLYAWEAVRQRTIDNFNENKKYMMAVSVYTLKKDLHIE